MISNRVFQAIAGNRRFISSFIIPSENHIRVYVYIYDDTLNPDGSEDKLQNGSTDHTDYVWPTNIWKRGTNAPHTGNDLLTVEKWDLVTNSILMYVAPLPPATIYLEVATTPEEFGNTLILPSVTSAQEAADAAWQSAADAAVSVVVDPSTIDNDTVTATTIQTAFEQQETKIIYGGSF